MPAQNMVSKYVESFRNQFVQIPWENMADISYLGGIFNQTNYYYCVAYVADNTYMRGYPIQTSPICAGNFCGARNVTKAEFIQVVINLIAKYIFQDFSLDWKEAKNWLDTLDPSDYQYKTFNAGDIKTLTDNANTCKTPPCSLQNAGEVKTYLKYCMFNLSACGMGEIGSVKEWFWPVAELNLLYKQNIINLQEAEKEDIGQVMDGKRILNILYNLYKTTKCSFDNDYDCDASENTVDSCPNAYNPSQKDLDHDGIGNVCDDDIDGDGIKNPIWIVDDLDHIIIALLDQNTDNCLFIVNPNQEDSNTNGLGDACDGSNANDHYLSMYIAVDTFRWSAPIAPSFEAITQWKYKNIQRDMWDGTQESWAKISHLFEKPGTYIIKAFAKWDNANDAIAKTVVVIGWDTTDQKALQIQTDRIGGTAPLEITFSVSSIGAPDEVQRVWDANTTTTSYADQSFKKLFSLPGSYPTTVKMIKNNKIIWVSSFVVWVGNDSQWSMLKANMLNPDLGEKVSFTTMTQGFGPADIDRITWEFGDGTNEEGTSLSINHNFTLAGAKVIIQTIYLKGGQVLKNFITLFVVNKSLMASYALQTTPNNLHPNAFEKVSFATSIKGDTISQWSDLSQTYEGTITEKISQNTFPVSTSHVYSAGGIFYPETTLAINQCLFLQSQSTLAVNGVDFCLNAKITGTLKNLKCDLDKDGIPDVCDDDIDGDGTKNIVWLLKYENSTCLSNSSGTNNVDNGALDKDNTDIESLKKQLQWSCSLDNSPFSANPDQRDLNNDGLGDVGNGWIAALVWQDPDAPSDRDGDTIPDFKDLCPDIKETFNGIDDFDGCPEIGTELNCGSLGFPEWWIAWTGGVTVPTVSAGTCGNGTQDPWETCDSCPSDMPNCPIISPEQCYQCPCAFSDITASLTNWDQLKAVLRDKPATTPYKYSDPFTVDYSNGL